MSAADIDRYLQDVEEPSRSTLNTTRQRILDLVPQAEQCLSYAVPAFKLEGRTIAGLAAFKRHLSYLPHSGSVLPALADELADYEMTKSALHFAVDRPLPVDLIEKLLTVRIREAGLTGGLRRSGRYRT